MTDTKNRADRPRIGADISSFHLGQLLGHLTAADQQRIDAPDVTLFGVSRP
jgi:hypothetical protein